MSRTRERTTTPRKVKMTERKVQELIGKPPPQGSSAIEWTDLIEENLKLCVYPSGKASWRQRAILDGRKLFITLGPATVLGVDEVRERVRRNKALLLEGKNPKHEAESPATPTLKEFVDQDFLPFARKNYKSLKDVEHRLRSRIVPQFGTRRLSDIRKADIVRYHEQVQEQVSSVTANRTLSLLSSLFKRAVELEIIEKNPAQGVKKFYEGQSRDRYLNDDELQRFIKVLKTKLDTAQGQAIFLLISLGLRRSEILSARWEHVNLEEKSLYIPDPKNRRPRYVALNSQAYELLRRMREEKTSPSPYLFPSDSKRGHLLEVRKTFANILKEAQITGVRLHDLRRTHASLLINSGASIFDVKSILGHEDIRSTQVYARLATSSLARTSEIAAKKIGQIIAADEKS